MSGTSKRVMIGAGLLAVCIGLIVMDSFINAPIGLLAIVLAAGVGGTIELKKLLKGLGLEVQFESLAAATAFLFATLLLPLGKQSYVPFAHFERCALLSVFVLLLALATQALWYRPRVKQTVNQKLDGGEGAGEGGINPGTSVSIRTVREELGEPVSPEALSKRFGGTLFAFVYLWLPAATVFALGSAQTGGLALVLFLVLVCRIGADSGAYFVGRWRKAAGKSTPFATHISPNKTREGVIGGLAAATLMGFLCSLVLPGIEQHLPWYFAIVAGFALGVVAIHGDLLASALKRAAGVKDSGAFLPEFGGVIDIVDGLLLAGPALYLIIRIGG